MTTTKSLDFAREIVRSRGGVCLVPLPGKGGISSHEKTFCDCEVEEMIAIALDAAQPPKVEESDREWPDEREYRRLARSWKDHIRAEYTLSGIKTTETQQTIPDRVLPEAQSPVSDEQLDAMAKCDSHNPWFRDAYSRGFKAGFMAGRTK